MTPVTLEKDAFSTYERVVTYSIRWLPVIGKGSLAILDQALISGSNFLIGILLARWMTQDQYGVYALTFSIFVLLSILYQSLLLEPQSVFGPSEFRENQRGYLGTMLWLQVGLSALILLVLGLSAFVGWKLGWHKGLPNSLLGVTIAAPCVLLFYLVRQACYVIPKPQLAVQGSSIYFVLVIALLFLVYRKEWISPFMAFLVMGLASLAACIFLISRLKPSMGLSAASANSSVVLRKHWMYGRWFIAATFVMWLPWNIYYTVLGRYAGFAEVGVLRVLMNLYMPLSQTLSALSLLLLPSAARKHGQEGKSGALGQTRKTMLLFAIGVLAYWAMVIPLGRPIMRFLYKGQYTDVLPLLPWIAMASLFWFCAHSTTISLRAIQAPSSVLVVYGAASIVCVLVGVPAARAFGIRGAIWGINLSSVAALATGIVLVRIKARDPH
jgi:O-antigen/teichoic acid export membrane protein